MISQLTCILVHQLPNPMYFTLYYTWCITLLLHLFKPGLFYKQPRYLLNHSVSHHFPPDLQCLYNQIAEVDHMSPVWLLKTQWWVCYQPGIPDLVFLRWNFFFRLISLSENFFWTCIFWQRVWHRILIFRSKQHLIKSSLHNIWRIKSSVHS